MFAFSRIVRCTSHSTFQLIEEGRLGIIRLNRASARNAFSMQMADTILQATNDVSRVDSDVRALILTGSESSFCAGRDLKASLTHTPEQEEEYLSKSLKTVKALLDCPIPVLVSIEKVCLGLGMELALAGDIRMAGKSSRLGFPEINLSLFPGCGGAVMLSALLNASVASDWILTGRRVTPEEARQVGFLHRVVEDGGAFNETLNLARDLVKQNRELLIKTKRVVKRQFNEKMRSEWWSEAEQLRREVGKHPDHREALIRFGK